MQSQEKMLLKGNKASMKNLKQYKRKPIYSCIKRLFDFFASFILIIILVFPMLIIGLAVKIDSKGPIIFKQERLGKNGKVFHILKFRSMVVGAESKGVYSNDKDTRLTKVGKFLRNTSLDELPQLFNIFIGQMSFVGPRPVLTYHPWKYSEYDGNQLIMFYVRPGITGWAQINGRKTVEWHKRIDLNVFYVLNRSIWFDIKILFLTVFKVFKNSDNENKGETI